MAEQLIKSKKRVKEHAEVFTPKHIVKDMLKLVRDGFEERGEWNPYLRYLEPACGNGNFLEEILREKMNGLSTDLSPAKYRWCTLKVLTSIYGVDIQEDNVKESIERMKKILLDYPVVNTPEFLSARDDILKMNIQVGNTIGDPDALSFAFFIPDDEHEQFSICLRSLRELGGVSVEELKKKSSNRKKSKVKS